MLTSRRVRDGGRKCFLGFGRDVHGEACIDKNLRGTCSTMVLDGVVWVAEHRHQRIHVILWF